MAGIAIARMELTAAALRDGGGPVEGRAGGAADSGDRAGSEGR